MRRRSLPSPSHPPFPKKTKHAHITGAYIFAYTHTHPTKQTNPPTGTVWDYHSMHLKIAGGMAIVASGKDIRTLLDETLADVSA
jgi:hypothetical protein